MFEILKSNDVEMLADAVIKVLETQGLHCENAEMLKAYEQAGAAVDYEHSVASFPRKVMESFVEQLRSEDKSKWQEMLNPEDQQIVYSGFHPYEPDRSFKACEPPYMFHNLSTYFYDDETGEKRPGNKKDFIELIKFGDGLHKQKGMGHALNLLDVPGPIEPLEAAVTLLEYSENPRGVYVHDIKQIPYLQEIEQIFGIDDPCWHWMANICPNSPLKIDDVVAERFVYMVKSGLYPAKLAAMPVAGVNVPVTVAGMTIIIAAEFMALWFAARALQSKKIPLTGLPVLGTMDIKSGQVSYSGYDVAIRRFTVCEFIRKWADIQLAPGPGEWAPTKVPGLYCALEKAYFAMSAAAFTGHHPEIGVGHIDNGLSISCLQFLLDWDLSNGLKNLEPSKIDSEHLCLEGIFDVGFGFDKNYMEEDYTLGHFRDNLWMPEAFSLTGWSEQADRQACANAMRKLEQLKSEYVKPAGREEKIAKARKVIERAKRDLSD